MRATSSSPRRSGQASSTLLPRGAEVEVRVDDKGFHGSWYEATVVDIAPAEPARGPAQYTVKFVHPLADDGGDALKEVFPPSHVRLRPPPPPPSESSQPRFHLHNIVEASYCQGWWTGIVMSTPDSPGAASTPVTVGFLITRKLLKFPPHLVRPRRDYVDGDWVPSRSAMVVRPERPVEIYQVGDKVEVEARCHRHLCSCSWIPAAVVRVVDGLSYVVAYSDSKATEYVYCQLMRKPPDNSNGGQRRKVCAKIKRTERRQSMPGEMPSSPVDVVASSGDEHSHDPESSATKKPRKNLKQLDGILAEGLEHSPSGMDTPLSDRNRNDHVGERR